LPLRADAPVARFVGALPMVAAAGFYLFAAIPHLKREMWGSLHPYDAEMIDKSNGYEEHAATFMRARNARIGPNVVREWARGSFGRPRRCSSWGAAMA
jgi:hypothetical protein